MAAEEQPKATGSKAADLVQSGKPLQKSVSGKWTSGWQYESTLPIEKLWAIGGHFGNLDKYMESIRSCEVIGDPTKVGCRRRILLEGLGPDDFVEEKMVSRNEEQHVYGYEVLEPNILGFSGYKGIFKIDPVESLDGTTGSSWALSYFAEVLPVEGKTEEEFKQFSQNLYTAALTAFETTASAL